MEFRNGEMPTVGSIFERTCQVDVDDLIYSKILYFQLCSFLSFYDMSPRLFKWSCVILIYMS